MSLLFVLFYNDTFFRNTLKVYPLVAENIGFLLSIVLVLFAFTALLFTLVSSRWTTKPLLIFTVLSSSMTAYFMHTYHVVIDESMIRNTLQTDMAESMDLFSIWQLVYFVFLGVIPAYLVYRVPLVYQGFKAELWQKLKQIFFLLLLIIVLVFSFSKHYTSFVREHKPLRYTTNPSYWIYSIGKYISMTFDAGPVIVKPIGLDAKITKKPDALPKLVIMVVGEATRADHFSLNGYSRETNPLLGKEEVYNLSNVYACGTSTAASVPCMFSVYDKKDYSYKKGIRIENVLDVLNHTKRVSLLWRDNNSDSKGVALRIPYESYKSSKRNTLCIEGECRDEGMLVGLAEYIALQGKRDILIVLHQMGNHGPAYYKRYTKAFERFTPVCKTNQLEACTQEEIVNAYDNALLYTDAFLAKTIALLKEHDSTHHTAMVYMSDHGESLGENGIYLHGMPYFMAPDAQTHIATVFWGNRDFKESFAKIDKTKRYTQDNLFHTLLGLFDVKTRLYDEQKDICVY